MNKHKILIVDDETGYSQLMVDYFKYHGYDVMAANNLEDALNIFKRERPQAVLLDFNMPVVTGEKLLPMLQSIDPKIRVIVISGVIEEEVEEQFKGMGYFAFFRKGDLSLEKVKDTLEQALSY